MSGQSLSRRHFLKTSGMVGGGIVVAVALPGCAFNGPHPIEVTDAGFIPNAFLQIAPDNKITFYCPSDEMGQGIRTGLATIIGEELDVDPANMLVQAAGSHEDYNNPEFRVQGTGGSNAVRVFYQPLRQVGADTRALLLNAAALDLGIPSEQLLTDDGFIVAGDRRYPYGDFVDTASSLEMPVATSLKAPSNFQYIGADAPRVDALAKATGTASFGIDTDLPGMVYAVVVRPPVAGSKALKFDDSAARIAPGVLDIVAVSSGIAVVAERYWQAHQAAKKLTVDWEKRPLSSVTSTQVRQDLSAALEANDDTESSHVGDPEKAFAEADRILETDYYAPFLAHAPMEPLNATLRITENGADLWTGVQFVGAAQGVLERLTGLPRGDIKIHNQFLGGGFGRHEEFPFATKPSVSALLAEEKAFGLKDLKTYTQLQGQVEKIKDNLLSFLIERKSSGDLIVAYGAAAKGNTLLNYAGVKSDLLPFVCDAAQIKQGKFLPGSHIPIVPPERLLQARPDYVLIFPWNIAREIIRENAVLAAGGTKFVIAVPEVRVL